MVSYHVYAESWYWEQHMGVGNTSSSVYTRGPYEYMGTVSGSNDSVAIVNTIRNIPGYMEKMGCRKCDHIQLFKDKNGKSMKFYIIKDGRNWTIAEYDGKGEYRHSWTLASVNVKRQDADKRIKLRR